jgi:hypothetical protein
METNNIPKGWWLNVTVMARKENPEWLVGVLREGKGVWITEAAFVNFKTPDEAYKKGISFIEKYNKKYG